jgi:hypothetical protein
MTSAPTYLNALAVELCMALDRYEQDVEDLVRAWPDAERYRRVTRGMEQVRTASAFMPRMSITFVELLIAHAELVQGLWDSRDAKQPAESVWPAMEQHRGAVFRLREACLTIMAGTQRFALPGALDPLPGR